MERLAGNEGGRMRSRRASQRTSSLLLCKKSQQRLRYEQIRTSTAAWSGLASCRVVVRECRVKCLSRFSCGAAVEMASWENPRRPSGFVCRFVTLSWLGAQAGIWHVPIGVTMAMTRSALEQVKQTALGRALESRKRRAVVCWAPSRQ